jgi:Ser/Thr protein kinase RdoA (MazF antagonist)
MKPDEVLHNWDLSSFFGQAKYEIKRPRLGLLNNTYLVTPAGSQEPLLILQEMHPAVAMDGALNNYFHVTQFLKEQGLVTQTMLPTKSGALWFADDQAKRWRLLLGVAGEIYEATTELGLAKEAGRLLAQFHSTLTKYPKPLEIGRLSFRYGPEIKKLKQFQDQLMADPDDSMRDLTQLLLKEVPKLSLPDNLPQRIIHADPKISNFVFSKAGQGLCMIDLDTIQMLSPLYDIGDAMRSWCGQKEDDPNNTFHTGIYHAFLYGYLNNSKGLLSEREQSLIPQAAKLIMLGLCMRFLNDYVEDSYFGWDETRYDSRKAHNKARALGQLSLYQSFLKST